jgi:fimbrial isopeptide formation D2 family protein/LPXTG-motif cell wall-anchored protein
MKAIRKIMVLAMAMVLVLAMSMTAFADNTNTTPAATNKGDGDFTITMTGAEDGHIFKAYKIFDGSLSADGTMGDIEWADGVNTEAVDGKDIYDEIKTALGLEEKPASAAAVAEALSTKADDAAAVQAVADIFYARKGSVVGTANTKTGDNYEIKPLTVGYYLVTDEYNTGHPADGDATLSRNILAVVGDVTAAVKNDKPTVEKKILSPTPVDANKAGIGDTVAFQITGQVPNYTGYDKYFYVINDTLSSGLTFDGPQNVVVKVGETTLTNNADYVVYSGDDAAPHTFEVAFKNIKGFEIGTAITVTYTATVNTSAAIGSPGNKNETDVTYSNNPNNSSHGNPSTNPKPDQDVPTGTSAKDVTVTYVAELDLTKYKDAIGENNLLAGATFTLTGTANVVKGKGSDIFVEDPAGAYWKLKDGTYTTTAPHGDIKDSDDNVKVESNESSYDSTTTKYALQHVTEYEAGEEVVFMQGTSGDDGKITFTGLGAGTYTLTEVVTPTGFNTADPITFTIVIDVPATITTGDEDATYSVENVSPATASISLHDSDATCGIYETNVIDKSGSVLPSTGGIGTTIFYVLGAVLVLGGGILLISRRRMNA